MKKTFTSKIDFLEKLKMHHFTVMDEVLAAFCDAKTKSIYNQRFSITLNDTVTWKGGTVALGNQSAYIAVSKDRMKTLGIHEGDEVSVTLEKDNSKYGLDVPQEFEEVLRQDSEAKKRFESLTMGFQRAIIYMIIQFKSSDKRIEKSIFFLENLKKSPEGKTTMRHVIGKDLPY